MNYMPAIKSADPVERFRFAGHTAVLLDNIVSAGSIGYRYVLVVCDGADKPCLCVASEVSELAAELGGRSHFLDLFPGDGHENYGSSDDWADRAKFAARAIEMATARLSAVG